MDMPCDAKDSLVGKGCSARYFINGQTLEQKIPAVNTGNYCKDRYLTLSALCDKRADDYKIQCLK
jgi:hypothetical protein